MELLDFALAGNANKFYNNLKKIGKKTGKSAFWMFLDSMFCTLILKSGYSDYLNYKFYEKNWKQRRRYVTIGIASKFYNKYSPKDEAMNIIVKPSFHKNYAKYTQRDYYIVEFGIDKLNEFLTRHANFVIKPVDGLGGTSVKKMKLTEIGGVPEFFNQLKMYNMYLEEIIVQNEDWGKLSPNSTNTIRIMTSVIRGKPQIFCAIARIGNGKVITDNFHQGGIGVEVDIKNGILVGNGINKNLEEVDKHPITKVRFDGYKIPFWEEAKQMVSELALDNSKVTVVGWDVAIGKNGPVIVEANRRPGYDLVQVVLKRGTKYMIDDIIWRKNEEKQIK